MAKSYNILELKGAMRDASIGNKARSLWQLAKWKYPVPQTWICSWKVYENYVKGNHKILQDLESGLTKIIIPGKKYAVRSSTNLEDKKDFSFAGQFKTVLGVMGIDGVLSAITSIWESASVTMETSYNRQLINASEPLKVSVIIQEYVEPVLSGVAFSLDPVTGQDVLIIEAVRGSGEQLVQQGVTPYRWIFRHGRAVTSPGEMPGFENLASKIAGTTVRLAKRTGMNIDLEWVYDGREVFWLQMREITGLNLINVYSNKISREVLPGMIKPLVFSVNIPLVVGAQIRLISKLCGNPGIQPGSLVKSFYHRAYFNMGLLGRIFESIGLPADGLETMMGVKTEGENTGYRPSIRMLRHLFRVLRFIPELIRHESILKKEFHPLEIAVKSIDRGSFSGKSPQEVMDSIDHLFRLNQEIAYYNIVTPLLNYLHNYLLKKKLKKSEVAYEDLDFSPGTSFGETVDPNISLKKIRKKIDALTGEQVECLTRTSFHDKAFENEFAWLKAEIGDFLALYGHFSESGNDFTVPPWRENPDLVLKMILMMESIEQEAAPRIKLADLSRRGLLKPSLARSFRRAVKYRYYRDRLSSVYTYGYGLFRDLFLQAGRILASGGVVAQPGDVFYLTWEEIREALLTGGEQHQNGLKKQVEARKEEMERYRDIILPSVIYGDDTPPVESLQSLKYEGIAASPGYCTGRCVIVKGYSDFDRVTAGSIIVIPYSDVGWTPIFVRAGAIIAESGGMLSHSSIVARELRIPAVVSVENACLIPDGTLLTVDGYKGRIILEAKPDPIT